MQNIRGDNQKSRLRRLADFLFWIVVAGAIVYIFWPTTSLMSKVLKSFFALLLFGMAYAEQLQRQFRELEAKLAMLEKHNSEMKRQVDVWLENLKGESDRAKLRDVRCEMDRLKEDFEAAVEKIEDLKTGLESLRAEMHELGS